MGLNDVAHKIEAAAGAHFAVGIVAPVTLIKDMGGILGRDMRPGGKDVEFDAVFAGDDDAALGVLFCLRLAGIKVPDVATLVAKLKNEAKVISP